MKKKIWMISALIYAMVFLVCFGVLFVLKKWTETDGQRTEISSEYGGEEAGTASGAGAVTPITGTLASASDAAASPADVMASPSDAAFSPDTKPGEDGIPGSHAAKNTYGKKGYSGWKKELENIWEPDSAGQAYTPPRIILATDLHYQSAKAGDGGKAFQRFVEYCDGKVVRYLPELLDAFLDEVIKDHPSALVLSGDITMNGERMNHEELSEGLKRVQDAGIQVLVIPGNHDINNGNAAVYFGDVSKGTDSVSPEEFLDLYRDYGYRQALSRDEASLSYVYALDEKNWLLMLDSCQYEPENLVEGRIRPETLTWAEKQLIKAKEDGIFVIPIAHHNLLAQSRMYTTQCAMENNGEVISLLQKYELPLFFSGHLHVQRIRKHKAEPGEPEEAYGIQEIITDAISIPPCQYGELVWKEDGSLEYATRAVDVSAWARKTGSTDENLLEFEAWSYEYIRSLISAQIRRQLRSLGEEIEQSMSSLYAGVYMDYYAGRKIDLKEIQSAKGYRWWKRNMPDSALLRELEAMAADADRDNNYFLFPEGSGWER